MKYNDNGEYKDIYVKAFDTLPVGTEVDYDGETVPSGWTQVSGKTYVEYELYNNTSGTNGNLTLNDTVDNYDYLEIFFSERNARQSSIKIRTNGNITNIVLTINFGDSNNYYFRSVEYSINNKTMSKTIFRGFYIRKNDGTIVEQEEASNVYINIYKVVGYKEA